MKRFSKEELSTFRELINNKIEVYEEEVKYLKSISIENGEAYAFNAMEETEFSNSFNMRMLERRKTDVLRLRSALSRIESETYGICLRTGKPIDKKRLMLVPDALFSI
jgi:DnaK suppressor protein